jgi:hypothetical protein
LHLALAWIYHLLSMLASNLLFRWLC